MQGIAKMYGFDKKDFEFVDYDKAKDFTGKIRRDGKCYAVIFVHALIKQQIWQDIQVLQRK